MKSIITLNKPKSHSPTYASLALGLLLPLTSTINGAQVNSSVNCPSPVTYSWNGGCDGQAQNAKSANVGCDALTPKKPNQETIKSPKPLVVVLINKKNKSNGHTDLNFFNGFQPEVLPTNSNVSIYPMPNCPRAAICLMEIVAPNGKTITTKEILPIYTENTTGTKEKVWPSVTLPLGKNGQGYYNITCSFINKNGEVTKATSTILVNDGKKSTIKSEEKPASQLLSQIEEPLEYSTPETQPENEEDYQTSCQYQYDCLSQCTPITPSNTSIAKIPGVNKSNTPQLPYSRQEVIKTIKDFFSAASKDDFSPAQSSSRAKMIDLAHSLDTQEATRWVISSLPLWREIEDNSPAAQLAQKTADLIQPADLTLLADLLEFEIDKGAKLWALSIMSRISNPTNTDILQALVLESVLTRGEEENKQENEQNLEWSTKKAALEALSRMGSKKNVLFLFDLMDDQKISKEDKETISLALKTFLPANRASLNSLYRISKESETRSPDSVETCLELLNLIEQQVVSNEQIEE
jgi:hypothetical protein